MTKIASVNDIGQRHGYWEEYDNGLLLYKGMYNNDESVGYWVIYANHIYHHIYYII